MNQNPLQKLYRNKNIFVTLPSAGSYYSTPPKLSVDGEIGIMSMTAADEIKLKTPDSLFNGESLFDLFQSCVPDITDPREIPACDVDKILLAIRVATSGPELDITSTCPSCNKKEVYQIDLTSIMNTAKPIPTENIITLGETEIYVRPLTLANQIKSQMETFYHLRMQQLLNEDTGTDEESIAAKSKMFDEALVQAIVIQTSQVADCITKVIMDDEEVITNRDHIFEWVKNMDSATHKQIKKMITSLSDARMDSSVHLKCAHDECNHEYTTRVDLNPVNFF